MPAFGFIGIVFSQTLLCFAGINVWTFILEHADSSFEYIVRHHIPGEKITEHDADESIVLRTLMETFCRQTESHSVVSAVALVSWILKDIGILLDETNTEVW